MGGWRREARRVERWRGYVSSSFFVRFADGTLLESKPFRWRGRDDPPDEGAARAALDALLTRAREAGWTVGEPSGRWFAVEVARLVPEEEEVEAEHVPPAPPPPPAAVEPPPPPSPVPAPAPSPAPPPAAPNAPRPRRRLLPVVVAGAAAAGAVAAGAVHALGGGDQTPPVRAAPPPRATAKAAAPAPTKTAAAVPPARPHPARRTVDVRIVAGTSGSWLELRRGSATGAVLYSGTLAPGQALHFRAPRIWARFGAASNLSITAGGRPVALEGTYDKLFVPAPTG